MKILKNGRLCIFGLSLFGFGWDASFAQLREDPVTQQTRLKGLFYEDDPVFKVSIEKQSVFISEIEMRQKFIPPELSSPEAVHILVKYFLLRSATTMRGASIKKDKHSTFEILRGKLKKLGAAQNVQVSINTESDTVTFSFLPHQLGAYAAIIDTAAATLQHPQLNRVYQQPILTKLAHYSASYSLHTAPLWPLDKMNALFKKMDFHAARSSPTNDSTPLIGPGLEEEISFSSMRESPHNDLHSLAKIQKRLQGEWELQILAYKSHDLELVPIHSGHSTFNNEFNRDRHRLTISGPKVNLQTFSIDPTKTSFFHPFARIIDFVRMQVATISTYQIHYFIERGLLFVSRGSTRKQKSPDHALTVEDRKSLYGKVMSHIHRDSRFFESTYRFSLNEKSNILVLEDLNPKHYHVDLKGYNPTLGHFFVYVFKKKISVPFTNFVSPKSEMNEDFKVDDGG